mmetsp:Transcript_15252/g.57963  ORF Transcript_15252/g.57963 Transcript_15252/m.57963 type:complete len:556 (-) Transcript_15252:1079-2746(-)
MPEGLLVRLDQGRNRFVPGGCTREGNLGMEVRIQQLVDSRARSRSVFAELEQLRHEGRVVVLESVHDVHEASLGFVEGLDLDAALDRAAEGAIEGADLLGLARVLQVQAGQQISGVDDRAGAQRRLDLSGFGGLQGHDHLHGLDLHVRLSGFDLVALFEEVADDLSGHIRAQLGRVVHRRQENRRAVEAHAESQGLLACDEATLLAAPVHDERLVALLTEGCVHVAAIDGEANGARARAGDGEDVLRVLVGQFHGEGGHGDERLQRDLPLLQVLEHGLLVVLDVGVRARHHGADDDVFVVEELLHLDALLADDAVQPARVDGVLLEGIRLEQLGEVLDGGADLSAHLDVLQGHDEVLAGFLSGGSLGKEVPELGVGVLVDAAVGADAEVAPDVGGRLELDAFDGARRRLEAFVGVLRRDTSGDDVIVQVIGVLKEVDVSAGAVRVLHVEAADVRDAVQGQAHGDLQLRRRHVHLGDALRDGVLHLEARVQLQEVVLVIRGVVQVLDGAGSDVADALHEALRRLLHFVEPVDRGDGRGTFLEDLLEAALGAAVAAV